jgi:hypothetical protein
MTSLVRNLTSVGAGLVVAGAAAVIAARAQSPGPAATTTTSTTTTVAVAPAAAPATTRTPAAAPSSTAKPAPSPAASAQPSSSTTSDRPGTRESYRDRYAVLADRNIFVRERWKIIPTSERERPNRNQTYTQRDTPRLPPAEASYILTGIILPEPGDVDGQVHAIVEDMKAGKILRLSVGDDVARGHISDMSIDAVQYSASGLQVWVELGRDFTGAIPASPSAIYAAAAAAGATTTGSTTGPTSAPTVALPLDPNNPNLSLEERMKIRRMQQMGGQSK